MKGAELLAGRVGMIMRTPLLLLTSIVVACNAVAVVAQGNDAALKTGTLKGRVVDVDTEAPIKALVEVRGASLLKAITLEDGLFEITGVPAGTVTVSVYARDYRFQEWNGIEIQSGEVTSLDIAIEQVWPDREIEHRSIVGTAVHVDAGDLACRILPLQERFRVGDKPQFKVVLRNESGDTFYLVGAIDNSDRGTRYPHVSLTIEGPENGISRKRLAGCGWENALQERDFLMMPPGGTIEPITIPFWPPAELAHAEFARPGTYVVTFHYSSNEADYAYWMGGSSDGYAPTNVVEKLKRVPRLELECSTTVEVYE